MNPWPQRWSNTFYFDWRTRTLYWLDQSPLSHRGWKPIEVQK